VFVLKIAISPLSKDKHPVLLFWEIWLISSENECEDKFWVMRILDGFRMSKRNKQDSVEESIFYRL
jgi:hypothetical protein